MLPTQLAPYSRNHSEPELPSERLTTREQEPALAGAGRGSQRWVVWMACMTLPHLAIACPAP
ncbi:MAG: hypothetical protein HC911_06070 [Chloroflexaceae bacterium]|nr:hypothetical protein [Chloroflexaceae bacterium]